MTIDGTSVWPEGVVAVSQTDECDAAASLPGHASWPCDADVRYFRSELQIGFTYINAASEHPPAAGECLARALNLYVLLSGWVQSNGGCRDLERQLQWFRRRLGAAQMASAEI